MFYFGHTHMVSDLWGIEKVTNFYITILKYESSSVNLQKWAEEELIEIKDQPGAVKLLITTLKDEQASVRAAAAKALGETGDSRVIDPLIITLKDEQASVRAAAAMALGVTRDPRVIDPLISTLKDEDSDVQDKAKVTLMWITGQNFGKDITKWQKWWEKNKGKMPDMI